MERFLEWSAGCYNHPWLILATTALITIGFGLGVPKVKFDYDIKDTTDE